jgi:hypothetical protein
MNEKPKTVDQIPNPDKVSTKKIGTSMIEPVGPVGKGSLEDQKMDKTFSPSATPKATMGAAPAVGADAAKKDTPKAAPAAKSGGGMGA